MSTMTAQDHAVENLVAVSKAQIKLLNDLSRYLGSLTDVDRINMQQCALLPMETLEDLLEGAYQTRKTTNIKFAKMAISVKVLQEQDLL